jgi:predicted RNase H-like HicB family nuclease
MRLLQVALRPVIARVNCIWMKQFTLEYWMDDGWYVGRLKEMPAVMSQGETLEELQGLIRDAYRLMVKDAAENSAAAVTSAF